jgi:putative acetyltransferase
VPDVRPATAADGPGIRSVLSAAFGRGDEADLVEALERDGDVLASLVAVREGAAVGHALLSRLAAPYEAAALAPVAVAPALQRQGIGAALVCAAVEAARARGCRAVFVLGDPAYYGRFGFTATAASGADSPYAGAHFMALALDGGGPLPAGPVVHARAFG